VRFRLIGTRPEGKIIIIADRADCVVPDRHIGSNIASHSTGVAGLDEDAVERRVLNRVVADIRLDCHRVSDVPGDAKRVLAA